MVMCLETSMGHNQGQAWGKHLFNSRSPWISEAELDFVDVCDSLFKKNGINILHFVQLYEKLEL